MFYSKNFKKLKNIKHCFFSRKRVFKGIYKSLNCGRVQKIIKNIINNLNFVALKLKVKKEKLILMHQTHAKVVGLKR